jgi:hypothetical protein
MKFVWFMGKINYNMNSYHSCRKSSFKNEEEISYEVKKNNEKVCVKVVRVFFFFFFFFFFFWCALFFF